MTSSTYPSYKAGPADFLGTIPSHWRVKPFRRVFGESNELNGSEPVGVMLSVSGYRGVEPKVYESDSLKRTDEMLENYRVVRPGQLAVNTMWLNYAGLGVSSHLGHVSPAYRAYWITEQVDDRYIHHLLRSEAYVKGYTGYLRGIRPNSLQMDRPTLMTWPVLLPPLDEQHAIADYLDRETARIDNLIETQERLIELLRERRVAAVMRALLRGLDSAPLKESHVPLLGEVPAHWRIVPTRYLCTITTGTEDSGNATDDGLYPFYVRGREILRIHQYSFDCEAVMTPGDGQGGTGKVFHYFNGKFEAHQRVYVFKDFKNVLGWYFHYFLSSFLRPVALAGSNTVTMESLRRPLLADFPVVLPPIDEQRRILVNLDEQTARIDNLIGETERFIELSRERRSALITAAVTGQIDVRGEVA